VTTDEGCAMGRQGVRDRTREERIHTPSLRANRPGERRVTESGMSGKCCPARDNEASATRAQTTTGFMGRRHKTQKQSLRKNRLTQKLKRVAEGFPTQRSLEKNYFR